MIANSVAETLQSLVEITEVMSGAVDREQFDSLPAMLGVREELLAKQSELMREWGALLRTPDERNDGVVRFGPLMETLKQVDKKFVTLCGAQLEVTVEKLAQAQNQKLLLAYSR